MTSLSSTSRSASIAKSLFIVILLTLFLIAIHLLGSSFKLLGSDFTEAIFSTQAHPFTNLFIGILATALVQSSSVTTSIIVGLVSGGIVSIDNAIPMVMGANIGTTITNTLVSFGHVSVREEFRRAFAGSIVHDIFNWLTVIILFPIEMSTRYLSRTASALSGVFYGVNGSDYNGPVKVFLKAVDHGLQDLCLNTLSFSKAVTGIVFVILSVVLIFITLFFIVKVMKSMMLDKIAIILDRVLSKSAFITIIIGMLLTMMVQSSSITTSLLVPMLGAGILTLENAYPITLGANIGTTITALLASLAGTQAGLTIALVHLLFNISGTLIFYPIPMLRNIPLTLARRFADLCCENRKIAVLFILFMFLIIPALIIYFTR